jgi:hypothetical protein
VELNAAGEGSGTTVREGVALDELLSDGTKYLNVHAVGLGDPPQLTCANLGEATQHISWTSLPSTSVTTQDQATARPALSRALLRSPRRGTAAQAVL